MPDCEESGCDITAWDEGRGVLSLRCAGHFLLASLTTCRHLQQSMTSHDLWHVNRKQRDSWDSIINNGSSVGFILQSFDRWSDRSVTLCVEATSLPVCVFNPSQLLLIDYYHVHEWSGRSSSSPSVASSSCVCPSLVLMHVLTYSVIFK